MLYELLIGALPFDAARRCAAPGTTRSSGSSARSIRRGRAPSSPGLGESAQEIAQRRQTQLDLLHQQLKSELEWIPLKAMRPRQPAARSGAETCPRTSAIISRSRPLRRGPESRTYRARKFLRRNKTGVAASAAMILLLARGYRDDELAGDSRIAPKQRGRANAQATLDFLTNDVLAAATPETSPTRSVRNQIVAAMITPAAQHVGEKFKDRPIIEASIRETIRSVLVKIGRRDLALPHAERRLQFVDASLAKIIPTRLHR